MYTKQTRGFRIPDLLREIYPQLGENGVMVSPAASAYVLFTLSCVQWCLGMPSGEKPDSYKSKMNKNIARWLLKELQRKGMPSMLPSDVMHAAHSVVAHILENNIDPDLAQELASIVGISAQLPSRYTHSVGSPKTESARSSIDSRGGSFEGRRFSFDAMATPVNSVQSMRGESFVQFKELLASNMTIHQIHAAIPRMSVDHRLFLLVAKSPGGLLGARIPSLYREVFGDRLRLQGRKLKDILLSNA